jgi:hypothetical protein
MPDGLHARLPRLGIIPSVRQSAAMPTVLGAVKQRVNGGRYDDEHAARDRHKPPPGQHEISVARVT